MQAPPAGAVDELENLDPDVILTRGTPSQSQLTPFDDIIISFSEAQLIDPMVRAGQMEDRVTMARKQRIIDQLIGGLSTLLKHRKVTVYDGIGSLRADRRVVDRKSVV